MTEQKENETIIKEQETLQTDDVAPEMRTISDEEWENPPPLEGKNLEIHNKNVLNVRRLVVSFAIAKVGLLSLIAVVLWKFFGDGRGH